MAYFGAFFKIVELTQQPQQEMSLSVTLFTVYCTQFEVFNF